MLCAFNNLSSNTAECRWISTGTNGILNIGLDTNDYGYIKAFGNQINLHCADSGTATMRIETANVVVVGGNSYANNFIQNSSRTIKKDIVESPDYSSVFDSLKVHQYSLKNGSNEYGNLQLGLIAEDVHSIQGGLPISVSGKTVNYQQVLMLAVAEIQRQRRQSTQSNVPFSVLNSKSRIYRI